MIRHLRTRSLMVLALLGFGLSVGQADTPATPAKAWKDAAEGSVVSTNGNSKTTTTSAKNTFDYNMTSTTLLELTGGALGASSGGDVTAEQYNAAEKTTWNYFGKNYLYERFGWDKDRFSGIQDRYDGSAGLGRQLIDSTTNQWNLELGPGYINEERIGAPRNDFVSGRAFTKYAHNFTPATTFTQTGEFLANFKDSNGFRINTESAFVTALSTHLSLKTSFTWHRVNVPVPGTVKDDTTTAVALIVNY